MEISPIGKIHNPNGSLYVQLFDEYKSGLTNINKFSHHQIIWWGNLSDELKLCNNFVIEKPYKTGQKKIGVFATRSQFRF